MEMDRLPLLEGWRFCLTEAPQACAPDFDDRDWAEVALPHDWQIGQLRDPGMPGGPAQGFFPRCHLGVYRLSFFAPEQWRGKTVRALFDGIQHFGTVYLNGREVGGRPYGYVPVLCELDGALRYGQENLLAVRVDNRESLGDRWYSGAGLYRNAWLLVDEPSHLIHDGLCLEATPAGRGAQVSLRAQVAHPNGAALRVEIVDPAGQMLAQSETPAQESTACHLTLPQAALWSPQSPALYTARLTLHREGQPLDTQELRFGVRSAVFDGERGFLLNGRPTKLWGVNLHHDGGCVGAAVPLEVWRRRLTALKKMGANTLRASHNPQAEEFYGLCDEMGFLVVDELYDKWNDSGMYFDRVYPDWHLRDLEAMIARDRNHPCVILWSVGNEIGYQFEEAFFDRLQTLCDHARRLDPSRAVSAALNGYLMPNYNDNTPLEPKIQVALRYAQIVDVYMGNYLEQFYETLREAGMCCAVLGSEVRVYYRLGGLNSVQPSPESPLAIVKRYDWVCGALIWAGIDYLGETMAWPCRGWTSNPLDSTGDPKLQAWYLAAQWQQEPVLRLAVYDEGEPWTMPRRQWCFPAMRSHWRYETPDLMKHVVALTNCDEVHFILNDGTARIGWLRDFPDAMIHMDIPYAAGVLRALGYRKGELVATDALHSDHRADTLRLTQDREALPADGRSVAHVDLYLEDAQGRRYVLENPKVTCRAEGGLTVLGMDNGDPMREVPFSREALPLYNGHLMILVQAGKTPGPARLLLEIEGFGAREAVFTLTEPEGQA